MNDLNKQQHLALKRALQWVGKFIADMDNDKQDGELANRARRALDQGNKAMDAYEAARKQKPPEGADYDWDGQWDAPGHGSYVIMENGREMEPHEVIRVLTSYADIMQQVARAPSSKPPKPGVYVGAGANLTQEVVVAISVPYLVEHAEQVALGRVDSARRELADPGLAPFFAGVMAALGAADPANPDAGLRLAPMRWTLGGITGRGFFKGADPPYAGLPTRIVIPLTDEDMEYAVGALDDDLEGLDDPVED